MRAGGLEHGLCRVPRLAARSAPDRRGLARSSMPRPSRTRSRDASVGTFFGEFAPWSGAGRTATGRRARARHRRPRTTAAASSWDAVLRLGGTSRRGSRESGSAAAGYAYVARPARLPIDIRAGRGDASCRRAMTDPGAPAAGRRAAGRERERRRRLARTSSGANVLVRLGHRSPRRGWKVFVEQPESAAFAPAARARSGRRRC